MAGVDIDALLPLYVSVRMSDDLDRDVRQVQVGLDEAHERFLALHDALEGNPWGSRRSSCVAL